MEHAKHTKITSEVRDAVLRLNEAGLKSSEIADILNVSSSSVSYTIQCYKAAESNDWKTLHKLIDCQRQSVKWALNKFGKTLPDEAVDAPAVVKESLPSEETVPEMYAEIKKALNGIGFLLSEILAELR